MQLDCDKLGAKMIAEMSGTSGPIESIRFGLFEFDPHSGEFHKQGSRIKFQGQPVEILFLLLSRAGELVTPRGTAKSSGPPIPLSISIAV